ncbi:hypothetical protein OPKNFCMD_6607 [Methylobacterium crusticola]|uniref:DUF308 domain-containing protein n=1 Tax=Methylobacterium crusticola TaxID=1697972 RepID=A0ABQ4R7X4_9HYPH|nr:DUF308 domain-containing protein [Methylobacterium crusticola]GJD53828.1 hypothetical protein OPKNFCMD_6607 [Methylobacterium crusticola]
MALQVLGNSPRGIPRNAAISAQSELRNYYYLRAGVAALWVAAAFTVGKSLPPVASTLLVAYPAWDALANVIDAKRNGGFARNQTQLVNVAVSGVTALAVAVTLSNMNTVLGVFGVWATLAGLLQLATGVGRWRTSGAQWAMILSGAQSALAGCLFVARAFGPGRPGIVDIAPYAAFGAFYFLVSALLLTFRRKASTA